MKTKEYFEQLDKLTKDGIHPEFHTYAAVWIKARMPEAYEELITSFKNVEGEIYAHNERDGVSF
jgi:hypothetical protein